MQLQNKPLSSYLHVALASLHFSVPFSVSWSVSICSNPYKSSFSHRFLVFSHSVLVFGPNCAWPLLCWAFFDALSNWFNMWDVFLVYNVKPADAPSMIAASDNWRGVTVLLGVIDVAPICDASVDATGVLEVVFGDDAIVNVITVALRERRTVSVLKLHINIENN